MEGACLSNLGLIHADAGQLDKAIEAYELALEVHASTGDKRNRGVVLGNLGNVYTNRGLHEQALQSFQEALQIHRETGDRRNTAFTHGYLGVHHGTQDRFEEALKEFEEATAIFRELGDKTQAGVNLGNQGEALQQLHRGEEALAVLEEAIRLCDEVQHYPAAGSFRGALGLLLATRGQMDEAHDLFRIGESQVKNMAPVLGKLLCQKGTAHLLDQRPGDARDALAQAQCIAEEMEVNEHSELARVISGLEGLLLDVADPTQEPSSVPTATRPGHLASLEGARLLEIGHIEREEGNSEQARANYQQALDHFREQGDREGEAEAHNGLGNAYLKLGDPDKAMEHLLLSLAYHREMGSQRFEGVILSNQGRFPEAFEHYRGALVIHEATGDTLNHAIAQGNLGLVSAKQGQQEEAIAHYQRSLALHRKVGSHGAGVILSNLGNAFHVQGRHEEALAHHQEALDIHRSTGSKRSEGIALGNLGRALLRLQRHEEARKALEEAIVICDESAPEAGGAFRSVLALLDASEGQFGNVEELLAHGEPLLEDTPFDHGKFLCNKGRVQLLQDQKRAAEQSLAQAQGIAEELEVTEHSELAQAIAEFKGLLAEA